MLTLAYFWAMFFLHHYFSLEDISLEGIWSCVKHPWRHLVHNKKSLKFGSIKNIHEHIWSMANDPWYLALQKMCMLRICPWVQIAHNIYVQLWFTGLTHKKVLSCFVEQWLCCCCIANNKDLSEGIKYLHGCFGQNQCPLIFFVVVVLLYFMY